MARSCGSTRMRRAGRTHRKPGANCGGGRGPRSLSRAGRAGRPRDSAGGADEYASVTERADRPDRAAIGDRRSEDAGSRLRRTGAEPQLIDMTALGAAAQAARVTIYVLQLEIPILDASERTASPTLQADLQAREDGLARLAGTARGALLRLVGAVVPVQPDPAGAVRLLPGGVRGHTGGSGWPPASNRCVDRRCGDSPRQAGLSRHGPVAERASTISSCACCGVQGLPRNHVAVAEPFEDERTGSIGCS